MNAALAATLVGTVLGAGYFFGTEVALPFVKAFFSFL